MNIAIRAPYRYSYLTGSSLLPRLSLDLTSMPLGTVAYAVVVIALSYFVLSRQIKKRRDPPLPPGPPRWPLVGSLFSMPKDNETREVFTSWGRQYGTPQLNSY